MVEKLLNDNLIDFVGIDYKGPYSVYQRIVQNTPHVDNVHKTLTILKKANIPIDVRTTVHRALLKESDIELALEERGIETDIECPGNLPLKIVGTELEAGSGYSCIVEAVSIGIKVICGEILIVARSLVSEGTIGSTHLQHSHIIVPVRHPRLF